MAKRTKPTSQKKSVPKAQSAAVRKASSLSKIQRVKYRIKSFLARRPHRSFQKTIRRDYVRSLKLPGYIAFTMYVVGMLCARWRTILALIGMFAVITALLVGTASQEMYQTFTSTLQAASKDILAGGWGEVGKAGVLAVIVAGGNIGGEVTEAQQIYTMLIFLMLWLTTVWLLRAQLADKKPRLRDALYNAGSPIISTFVVAAIFIAQLIPAALAVIIYSAALSTDLLANGVIAMVFFFVTFLLCLLTLYWITSTFIAFVVVALPGMYPWQAVRTAGDLVVGRRLRILLRLVWLACIVALVWVIIMLPVILLTTWLQTSIAWTASIPVVPVVLLLLGTLSTVFAASYVYLLYRKVVDDDARPA